MTLDAAGFGPTCEAAVWCVRRGGRVVQAGLPIGDKPPIVPMARVANRMQALSTALPPPLHR